MGISDYFSSSFSRNLCMNTVASSLVISALAFNSLPSVSKGRRPMSTAKEMASLAQLGVAS